MILSNLVIVLIEILIAMKKLYIIFLVAIAVCSCYEDKGNYDYKKLDEVEISLPSEFYSVIFGNKLSITPTITTSIPEHDLSYCWEIYGNSEANPFPYWQQYIPVDSNKILNYTCKLDDYMIREAGTYDMRLNITQISSGRHFYSETFQVKMERFSYTGAMVLHGNDLSSDIGIIVAEEFQLVQNGTSLENQTIPHYYSEMNGGETLKGKGTFVLQAYPFNGTTWRDNIVVIAVTDEGSAVSGDDFVKTGEWNDMFYGGLNTNRPVAYFVNWGSMYAFDGKDLFYKGASTTYFMLPIVASTDREIYPGIYIPEGNSQISRLAFDKKKRGFISVSYNSYTYETTYTEIEVKSNEGTVIPFNPANMQADLIYMGGGGAGEHVLAIMKKDNGDYFMAELDMLASSYSNIPKYVYDLTHVTDVQNGNVINWAFASSYRNMCYYATSGGVYQFSADDGKIIQPEPLKDAQNEILFDGTITLMKLLNPNMNGKPEGYYMTNEEMVVATYGGTPGSGILYSLQMDPFSGRVKTVKKYTGFDKIYDVNIKGL